MYRRFFLFIILLMPVLAITVQSFYLHANAGRAASVQSVSIVGPYDGDSAAKFLLVLADFYNTTGITAFYAYQSPDPSFIPDCTVSHTCPDLAIVTDLGLLDDLASQSLIHPLNATVTDFDTNYSPAWRRLSSVGQALYSVPFQAGHKSLVWYRPDTFTAIGATIPSTWTNWISQSESLLTGGVTPFSIGAESDWADGWPLTDWLENILIGVGGVQLHEKLAHHNIAWTDPQVVEAMQYLAEILGNDDYQVGGSSGTINTFFGDAITPIYTPPYTAGMNMSGFWMESFLPPGLTPSIDYATFPFPMINPDHGHPVISNADQVVMISDTDEAKALIQYLASPRAAEVWLSQASFLSPNKNVNPALYPHDIYRQWAAQVSTSSGVVFDLDDQLPPELQQFIWQKLLEFASDTTQLPAILLAIELKASQIQGSPIQVYLPALFRQ